MGSYTTIIDEQEKGYQIKTGWDECATFKVGHTVPWRVIPNIAGQGYLLDGIYSGISDLWNPEVPPTHAWVVIRDHRIECVIRGATYDEVMKMYPVPEPLRSLWTEKAWEEKAERDLKIQQEMAAFKKKYEHLSPTERLATASAEFIKRQMERESPLRKILPPKRDENFCEHLGYDNMCFHNSQVLAEGVSSMPCNREFCPLGREICPEDGNTEWYCDSCDWVGPFVEVIYTAGSGSRPQCPKCSARNLHWRRKKMTLKQKIMAPLKPVMDEGYKKRLYGEEKGKKIPPPPRRSGYKPCAKCGERSVNITHLDQRICSKCAKGEKEGEICKRCNGTGRFNDPMDHAGFDPDDARPAYQMGAGRCPDCKGKGRV